jgi:hypothetical protein
VPELFQPQSHPNSATRASALPALPGQLDAQFGNSFMEPVEMLPPSIKTTKNSSNRAELLLVMRLALSSLGRQ